MAYTKKTWVTGEVIQAADLNHMEQGIAAADAAATGTGTIGTQQLADGSVTTSKIADGAVTGDKIANGAIGTAKLADSAYHNTAAVFDTTKAYSVGDYVIYSGDLYRFTADKTAGAWDSTKVVAVALADDVNVLNECKVDKSGENQVKPQNIEGVTFVKSQREGLSDNIFSESFLGESGYYCEVDTATTPPVLTHGGNASYRWYAIPVDGESTYHFTQARFACLAKGNTVGSEAMGTTLSYVTELTVTGASYLILSYSTSVTTVEVRKVIITDVYSEFGMPAWMKNGLDAKQKYVKGTANFAASGDKILLGNARSDLRKGTRLIFDCDVTSGTDFDVGFSVSESAITSAHNKFNFTAANITYNGTNYPHGLTVSGKVQVIFEYMDDAIAEITLLCNGQSFKQSVMFVNSSVAVPYVESKGLIATNCALTFTCKDINKPIWIFGDSYVQYQNVRWAYYLHEYGYDTNALINGFSGEGSVNGRVSFNKLLAMGTPKYAVWCMGMNDGSDSVSAPSADWSTNRDVFLNYSNKNNVTPIFATIPTVPIVNNEQKNAWIRTSGYRYIDFAKSVGANASGVWYSGMLSSDNVHPSIQGAKALFAQFLADFPEIMIDGL